jgi:hypothetical protein
MQIKEVKFDQDGVYITDENKIEYFIDNDTLEKMLIEFDLRCPICGDTGEEPIEGQVWAGEPHTAEIGTRRCICQDNEDGK